MENRYFLHGKLTAKEGHSSELARILLEASKLLGSVKGCQLYAIGVEPDGGNSVFVTEIWDTKEDHDASLNTVGVRELIMQAMPILADKPTKGLELQILGGVGVI